MRPITDSVRRLALRATARERRLAVWLVVVLWTIAAAVLFLALG